MSESPDSPVVLPDPVLTPEEREQRNWAMFCHLASLAGYFIPLGNVIGPLVIWLAKKETMPLVDDQGKEALNFQITVTIVALLCIPLIFVCIGIFLLGIIAVLDLVFTILAAIQASKGQAYRYPLSFRLVK